MFGNREYRSRHVSQNELEAAREENRDLRQRVSELEKMLAECHILAWHDPLRILKITEEFAE